MKNFKSMLAEAKLPERTVAICLRGDLAADHEAAERELEAAQKRLADSLEGNGVGPLVERIEALEAEMREHTYDFRFRALTKSKFRALLAAYPARRGEDGEVVTSDQLTMSNIDEMLPALVRACLIDPEPGDVDWADLEEKLTDRQQSDLTDAAWFVNRGEISIPFSRAASLAKRNSAGE